MSNTEASKKELTKELSQAWNHLSDCITDMLVSDPRWSPAAEWLNKNRQYQAAIPKLPVFPKTEDQAQSIESAPKDFKEFLAFSTQWGWIEVAWGIVEEKEGFFAVPFGWQKIEDLTHWTKLPKNP